MKKLIAVVASTFALFVVPASAQAYMHAQNCWNGVRSGGTGDRSHDDDIHRFGVYIGAAWVEPYNVNLAGHYDDTRAFVGVIYHYPNGNTYVVHGYCHGSDSAFDDDVPNSPPGW
jgi:hypothetical protein